MQQQVSRAFEDTPLAGRVSLSIGIALCPEHGDRFETLFQAAFIHSSFLIPHSSLFRFIELCSINRNSSPLPKTPNLKKTHKIAQNRLFFLDNLSNISI